MGRPHNKNARRRYYRELRQNNPADPVNPANPPNPNVAQHANLNASQSEMALHQPQPPRSATRKQKQKQKQKNAKVINNYYCCSHNSVPAHSHPHRPTSNPTPAPSCTPSTSAGGPTKKIPALMSLQLTKPVGYSFASNYIKEKIAKDNAAKTALVRSGTPLGPSQDKARATPFQAKAKVVCATPGPSKLVSPLKLVLWGSSHLTKKHGLPPVITRGIQFADFLNNSKGGKGLDAKILSDILNYLEQNPDPNQVFIFLFGGEQLEGRQKRGKGNWGCH